MTYKPLPKEVTIKKSNIDGLGLFATTKIKTKTILGITHISNQSYENGFIRTPLGGWINHSETPNCELIKIGPYYYLITSVDLLPDEEITLKYTLYEVKRPVSAS